MYKLSPSTLNLFKDCPRCFWLQFNRGIKRPNGIFPSLPSGIDKILKEYFDGFRDNGLPSEIRHLSEVKLFDIPELLNVWRSNFKGIQWKDDNGNIFRGAVDDILVKGNKLIVMDYKTRGFPLKETTAGYYKLQLEAYNFLLRKNGFETEDYAYLLFFIPQSANGNGLISFQTQLVKVEIDVKNAKRVFDEALEILKGSEPKCICEYCKGVV